MATSFEPMEGGAAITSFGATDDPARAAQFDRQALLAAIVHPTDVALRAESREDRTWRVTVCTSDHIGALAMIAGLFTAYRFDILSADIQTIHPDPSAERPVRSRISRFYRRPLQAETAPSTSKLLDVFEVRPLADVPSDVWQRFRFDLASLIGLLVNAQREDAYDALIERVSAAFRDFDENEAKLLPVAIDLSNDPDSPATRLSVRSADTPGFLFAFAFALAGFTVNIEQAEIRSVNGEAVDTFWVTDVGGRQIVREDRIHELRVATALIKHFTHLLPRSPHPGQALRQFNALIQQLLSRPQWTDDLGNLESPAVLATLADLMGVSRFLWEDFLRLQHENLFPVLVDVPSLKDAHSREDLRRELGSRLAKVATHEERVAALNAFKDRMMFRIDLRHITGRSVFWRFAEELSALAEVVVEAATRLAREPLEASFGTPRLADGRECPWSVCALGKFGGAELGFGSDLELLFVFQGEGQTSGPTPLLNSEYFSRLVQSFLSTLTSQQEGIFEIDLRLRPYGRAGTLASSLDGFQHYYAEGGAAQQFERMALVRLRPIVGDATLARSIVAARDDFVYSGRPLDLENVRHLRHRQATELVQPGKVNAKYSAGGLVDVEYYVQAWQIAVGHADPGVRVANTLEAITRLAAGGHLTVGHAEELRDAYGFLRRLIDALRVVRGHAKDLTIPPVDSREFAYLAQRLHATAPAGLGEEIARRMAFARALWERPPAPPG